jgi:endonuclease-3
MSRDVEALYGPAKPARIRKWFDYLAETIDPRSDLHFDDPFQLLVAVVLSAQATDKSVNEATEKLYPVAGTPEAILALGEEGLLPYIRKIGLAPTKSRNVIKLCRLLLERHDGQVPDNRAELEALPGVGSKTASVVLNIAFGQPTIAVDTHVHRVANRLGITVTKSPEQTEAVLLKRTPRKHLLHAHHYLILHGRYTCTARNPKCASCGLARTCPARAPVG